MTPHLRWLLRAGFGLLSTWAVMALGGATDAALEWPQWGGPNRNFQSPVKGLAASWPAGGPRQLWRRNLGEGYSAISVADGKLYTMYRRGEEEIVVAMEAATGKTVWEHRYPAPFLSGMKMENGPGPHSTPLVVGNQVFTVGINGNFFALDRKTGKVNWSHNLYKEFNGEVMGRGYACSPLAYKNTVILQVGGAGHAVMAFFQKDGSVAWKKQDFGNSFSSPILVNFDGQEQLVVFMSAEVAGLDPGNGEFLWRIPHSTQWGLNISTPVWGEGNLLFTSSAYNGGSRVIRLASVAGRTVATELWHSNRMRVHIGTAIRIGDYVYGSSGDFGPAFLCAVNVKTGEIAWQDRSFAKASFVLADGKLIIVDEDGNLALATVSPKGLTVHSKVALLRSNAWTPPSLAGTTLYVRDRHSLVALDLAGC